MKIDINKIKAKIAQLNGENKGKDSSKVQFWKPKPGDYSIRCMHWPEGVCKEGEMFKELFFYYGIGKSSILVPDQYGKPDPIKELRMNLFKSGTPQDKELAKKLFPKMRSYVPMVVLQGHEADEEQVLVYSFGSGVYQKLLGYFMNEKVGDYFDVTNGFNLNVKVSQAKGKSFQDVDIELDALNGRCPLNADPEKVKTILASIPDLSSVWQLKDASVIEKELHAWLKGENDPQKDTSPGESRESSQTKTVLDELDELEKEVKEEKKAPKKVAPKATKKEVSEEPESKTTDDLDAAFNDLMDD